MLRQRWPWPGLVEVTGSLPEPIAAELARTLRELAAERGMKGSHLATRLTGRLGDGFSQPKVSRALTGRRSISVMDAGRMAVALDADRDTLRHVIRLAADATAEREGAGPLRVALSRRASRGRERDLRRDQDAARIASFHPAVVPELLQTEDYVRAVWRSQRGSDEHGENAFVSAQLDRQRERRGRPALLIVTEGALCWGVAGPDVMIQQCQHIAALTAERPEWEIGVIPRLVPASAPIDYPPGGFDLYDEDAVRIGTTAGDTTVVDRAVIDLHVARLAVLRNLAVSGRVARAVLARIAADYERTPLT